MTLFEAADICFLRKYATFNGRASRSEFFLWHLYAFLSWILCLLLIALLFWLFNLISDYSSNSIGHAFDISFGIAFIMLLILYLVPTLAVTVRRLHDTGRSGVYLLIGLLGLIPYIGIIFSVWLFVYMCFPSDEDNEYGPKNSKATSKKLNDIVVEDVDLR